MKAVDATLGPVLCSLLSRAALRSRGNELPVPIDPRALRRILIIRPGGMGDMLVLLPVLKQLTARLPDLEVDLVCETRNMDVLRLAGLTDHALPYDTRPLRFLGMLRRHDYDLVLDTEQFHHFSAIFAFLSGAPIRIGYKINPRRNPLYTHLADYSVSGPEGRQFAALCEPLGIDPARCVLEGCLSGVAPGERGRRVAIHAGASTRYKQWPPERFAELAASLRRQRQLEPVLIGGTAERNGCERIAAAVRQSVGQSCAIELSDDLAATAAALRRSALFVGTDSGLAHLAVALGRPTVVLFGPSDHRKWGTQGGAHGIVRTDIACAPCFIFGYHRPCRTFACMAGITVAAVLDACAEVLEAPTAGR